ncbi:glucokinase [Cordyceps fumosorosea ARSEF 2679]|uniref:Gluconokinase n=1 Tax=Cordyceps fumosorosea (strain ARSEF 2679) TaxID=1081104 RepID=A0A162N0E1_CORFA|nr:glucokinase [Cordyceps fumosorosea ARSEF 2679]OAA73519.1 glucokinase [Cordyceps fumosorosea ARSEF 2679]
MLSYDTAVPIAAKGQDTSPAPLTATLPTSIVGSAEKPAEMHNHIWLVTGPAGCGKTTIAEHIAEANGMPYIEGDSYHTAANVEKMRTGVPLTDADRWDWLTLLRDESMRRLAEGPPSHGVVVTCSALKRKYRDVIRVAAYYNSNILIHFIYLDASEEVLLQRVSARQGHYMGANMVQSQFDILERPAVDETDVFSIDVSRSIEEVKRDALAQVNEVMNSEGV